MHDHLDDSNLTCYTAGGHIYVIPKKIDGENYFKINDLVVGIPLEYHLPDWMIDYFGDMNLDIECCSEGVLYPCLTLEEMGLREDLTEDPEGTWYVFNMASEYVKFKKAEEGTDYTDFLNLK
jgi:hypothetical protein